MPLILSKGRAETLAGDCLFTTVGAFRVARPASDQDDQAGMVSGLTSQRQKVIAVAAGEDQSLRTRVAKDIFIECGDWQHRA